MEIEIKYFCKKCRKTLPEAAFYQRKNSRKVVYPCKSCKSKYYKTWKEQHPEYHKNWKSEHPDQVKDHHKKYRDKQKNEDSPAGSSE